jgi:hypothetical protein
MQCGIEEEWAVELSLVAGFLAAASEPRAG